MEAKSDPMTRVGGRIMAKMTYAEMDKLLSSVGFTVRVATTNNKVRVYEHPETGAQLALAYRPDGETVLPHHLAAIQGTLKVYGIPDPLDTATQPQKAS